MAAGMLYFLHNPVLHLLPDRCPEALARWGPQSGAQNRIDSKPQGKLHRSTCNLDRLPSRFHGSQAFEFVPVLLD